MGVPPHQSPKMVAKIKAQASPKMLSPKLKVSSPKGKVQAKKACGFFMCDQAFSATDKLEEHRRGHKKEASTKLVAKTKEVKKVQAVKVGKAKEKVQEKVKEKVEDKVKDKVKGKLEDKTNEKVEDKLNEKVEDKEKVEGKKSDNENETVANKIEKANDSTKPEEQQKNEVNEAKLLEILGNLDTQDEPNRSESTAETKPETDSGTESDLESTEKHETQISKEQSKVLETLELTNVCKAREDDLRKQAGEVSKKEEAFKANVEDIKKEMKREH